MIGIDAPQDQHERKDEEVTDPREMRKRLRDVSYGYSARGTDRVTIASTVLNSCRAAAEVQGLSGEDAYVLATWHLHLALIRCEKQLLEVHGCLPQGHHV